MFKWKTNIMKKKTIIGLLTVTLLIILPTVIIVATRDKNFNDCFNEGIPDNEYLDVFDLRIADLMQDKEQKEYLEKLTAEMIKESYNTYGTSRKYADIISDNRFRSLNPKPKDFEYDFKLGEISPYCICTEDKAIVFFAKDNTRDGNVIICDLNHKKAIYTRLYYSKENGTWIVTNYDSPA